MKNSAVLIFALCTLLSCQGDREMAALAQRFEPYFVKDSIPEHQHLAALSTLHQRLDSLAIYRATLQAIDPNNLMMEGRLLYEAEETSLNREWLRWEPYRSDPALYNFGGLLKHALVQQKDRITRLQDLGQLLDKVEEYHTIARHNLAVEQLNRFSLAAQKQYLGLDFLQGELKDSISLMIEDQQGQALFQEKIQLAVREVKDFLAFCDSGFINGQDSSYYVFKENLSKLRERRD